MKVMWNLSRDKIRELKDVKIENKYKYLYGGSKFTITYYICPCCNERLLYKAPISRKFTIASKEEEFDAKSIYTCSYCRALYAPKVDEKLTEGNKYKLEYLDKDIYFNLLREIECLEER